MQEQIILTVNQSRISGLGLFAGTQIPANTILFQSFDVYGKFLLELAPNSFLNHSITPNLKTIMHNGKLCKQTIRSIAPGEELTVDYNQTNRVLATIGITPAQSSINTDFASNTQAMYDANRTPAQQYPIGYKFVLGLMLDTRIVYQ